MYGSHSKFELFRACPCAYKFHYINKFPEVVGRPAIMGRLFHVFAASYGRHCMTAAVKTDVTAARDIARRVFYVGDENGQPWPADMAGELLELAEGFARGHIVEIDTIVGLEERLPHGWDPKANRWPAPNVPDSQHRFVCIIDELRSVQSERRAIITDFKSAHYAPSESELKRDRQLRCYAWAVDQAYPGQFDLFTLRLAFPRLSIVREIEITGGELAEVGDEIRAQLDQIETTPEFPATPGVGCGICGYVERCPVRPATDGSVLCRTDEDALRVAGELIALDAQLKIRRATLQKWCVSAGPVAVNGMEVGYIKRASVYYPDLGAFVAALTAAGLDPRLYVRPDTAKLRPLRKNEAAVAALAAIAKDASKTVFTIHRAGADEEEGDAA